MAVNTQKLLPGSAGGALAIRYSKKTIAAPADKTKGGSLSKEILQMKTKIIRLQGEFAKNTKASQKAEETNRKKSEKEKSSKREKKFEQRGGIKGVDLPNVISKLPGGSIVDTIKRFLGFTLLGWLVGKYDKLMPQLEKFISVAKPVFDGIVSFTGSLFKGVYGFVEAGYKAYDKVSATIKQIGGENAEKTFNDFSSHLNKLLNGTLLMSMLIASTAPGRPGRMPGGKPGPGGGYSKPNQRLQSYLGRNDQTKLIERRYGNDAARMYEARRNQGASQKRSLADVRKRFEPSTNPSSSLADIKGSRVFNRGLAKAPQRAATKMFGKAAGKTVSKLGGRIPIVGPLIDFGIRTLIYKEPLGKAAAGAVGMGVGQALGGWLGGAIGGIIGSVVPIIGTMLVGAAGATVGSLIGGVIGDLLGVALYDFVAGSNNKGKATGQARGGTIGNRRPRRTSTGPGPSRRRIQPQPTKPGKDIGGRRKIEEFYGKDTPRGSIRTRGETIVKSLEKTSKDVKKLPLDWVASIGGAYIDMTMGQKPDKKLASDVGKSFGIFIDSAINAEVAATTGQITKALVGMANGGSIPTNSAERGKIAKEAAKNIEQRLQTIFDQSSTIALRNFKDQYSTLGVGGFPAGDGGGGGGAGPGGGTDIEKIEMGDFSSEDIDVLGRMIAAESGNQTGLGKAGVLSVILNRYRLAKSGDMGYMPSGKNKNTVTLKDIIYDEGQFTPITDGRFDRTTSDAGKNALAAAIAASGNDPQKFKQKLMSELNMSESDAETVVRATAFSNPKSRSRKPFDTKEVSVGDHSFQESPYSRIGSFPGAISAKVTRLPIGNIPKADYIKGVFDESGEPGFDVTWKGDNNVAILPGTIKEVGQLYGSGYGNVVVVESVDPVTGKKVDVLYAHFPNGGISVRPGDVVGTGQVLGRMGKPGEPGIGNITGQHASIDFYEPGSKNKYSNWQRLSSEIISAAQTGRNPSTWPKPGPPPGNETAGYSGPPTPDILAAEQARSAAITKAVAAKGAIPFTHDGKKFFFRVYEDGRVEAFKPKNAFGYQEPIDLGKNKALRNSINQKIQTMYGKPKPPTPGPGGKGYGGNMQKGGILGPYSSLNSIKEDTSYNKEMVVMYREKIVMVPSQQY